MSICFVFGGCFVNCGVLVEFIFNGKCLCGYEGDIFVLVLLVND